MAKKGKKYQAVAAKVADKDYSPGEALSLAKETAYTKFDPTVEVHIRLNVDPRKADEQVRDVVILPHGLGKTIRVLVFAQGEAAKVARDSGADTVADDDEFLKKIANGWLDFDVAISMQEMMGTLGKSGLARVLGPRGLMPNPKAGTVLGAAEDLPRAIQEAKAGRVEFRVDSTGNLHVPIGKASFDAQKLQENFSALLDAVLKARPAGVKGAYVRRVAVNATMGPSIKVDTYQAINPTSAV
ncbi:MAG TPA: 50S ribosomal protein L1 [Anaerolineales bacterium]|nr:50S ribosomal protein L1 [Anaerolineales bacterium]HRQ91849.1 50S ribosomal protein L1 [Anaerolineales bacterium]